MADDPLEPLRRPVSAAQLGRVVGVSGRRIIQLCEAGEIDRNEAGEIDLVDGVQAFVRFVRDGSGRGSDIEAVVAAAVRRALAEAGR